MSAEISLVGDPGPAKAHRTLMVAEGRQCIRWGSRIASGCVGMETSCVPVRVAAARVTFGAADARRRGATRTVPDAFSFEATAIDRKRAGRGFARRDDVTAPPPMTQSR